ncbi:MAG: hypothetical protein AAF687_12690 [Pseudomonadota bacterium]
MRIHPAIRVLRGDRAAQRSVQEPVLKALAQWHSSGPVARLVEALANYAAGAPLSECSPLSELMQDSELAGGFVRDWSGLFVGALSSGPLGEVPFQSRLIGGVGTVSLLRSGRATLALTAMPRGERLDDANTVVIADRECHEILIEGRASGAVFRSDGQEDRLHWAKAAWRRGDQIALGPRSARLITNVEQTVLLLQLSRTAQHPKAAREFDRVTGQFQRSASGDKLASRKVMALGVLGALEHWEALSVMGDVARDTSLDDDLRWEAVRQVLALDPASGMQLLDGLAQRGEDALARPAERLRGQLLRAYPQLVPGTREAA